MSVITYPLNGIDYDAENAETYLCTRVSGVYASDGHFDATVTDTRVVTIGKGLAWIRNTDHSGKSVYNDAATAITIPMADGAMDRIDRIVLRFSKVENMSRIVVAEGTPSAEPEPPEITRNENVYELGLYTVRVPAASVTISASDITDTRMDEEVCGLMRDGVTGIPTAQIQAQADELMESLRKEIADIEAGSEVMLKATYDPAGGEKQVAFIDTLYPVGSIYMSVTPTDPSTLFGGTWEQIEDVFLLAAGSTYEAGDTGGAATVALASGNIPSHTHSIPALSGTAASAGSHRHSIKYYENYAASGTARNIIGSSGESETSAPIQYDGVHTHSVTTTASTTGSTGSGTAHENMPPYLAVYMWQRIA